MLFTEAHTLRKTSLSPELTNHNFIGINEGYRSKQIIMNGHT